MCIRDRPQRIHTVRVYEVYTPGAVVELVGVDPEGVRRTLWSGTDPLDPGGPAGVSEIHFPLTDYAVQKVRVVLDTDRAPGWNEIDAVEIAGPGGSAWASEAAASSTYGTRQTVNFGLTLEEFELLEAWR